MDANQANLVWCILSNQLGRTAGRFPEKLLPVSDKQFEQHLFVGIIDVVLHNTFHSASALFSINRTDPTCGQF